MQAEIEGGPAFAFAEVSVPPGGAVRLEGGAMATTRGDVEVSTSTQGGFMRGLRRSLGGESFFVNDFTSKSGGSVGVAPVLPGDMVQVQIADQPLLVQSGSWVASDTTVDVDSKWGGSKGFFSGAGLVLLRCSGHGDLLLAAFGGIRHLPLGAGEQITIDTGHIVAFDQSVDYRVRKAGNWKTTLLSGEGLVTDFSGPGRVWLQTRNSSDLIGWLDASSAPRLRKLLTRRTVRVTRVGGRVTLDRRVRTTAVAGAAPTCPPSSTARASASAGPPHGIRAMTWAASARRSRRRPAQDPGAGGGRPGRR